MAPGARRVRPQGYASRTVPCCAPVRPCAGAGARHRGMAGLLLGPASTQRFAKHSACRPQEAPRAQRRRQPAPGAAARQRGRRTETGRELHMLLSGCMRAHLAAPGTGNSLSLEECGALPRDRAPASRHRRCDACQPQPAAQGHCPCLAASMQRREHYSKLGVVMQQNEEGTGSPPGGVRSQQRTGHTVTHTRSRQMQGRPRAACCAVRAGGSALCLGLR